MCMWTETNVEVIRQFYCFQDFFMTVNSNDKKI